MNRAKFGIDFSTPSNISRHSFRNEATNFTSKTFF